MQRGERALEEPIYHHDRHGPGREGPLLDNEYVLARHRVGGHDQNVWAQPKSKPTARRGAALVKELMPLVRPEPEKIHGHIGAQHPAGQKTHQPSRPLQPLGLGRGRPEQRCRPDRRRHAQPGGEEQPVADQKELRRSGRLAQAAAE
eukprot:scaffold24753_cov108-Isochrysis_galbana.AAC.1